MPTKRDLELYELKANMHKAFADPKRLVIIEELRKGQKSIGDLTRSCLFPRRLCPVICRAQGAGYCCLPPGKYQCLLHFGGHPRICDVADTMHYLLLARIEKNRRLVEKAVG